MDAVLAILPFAFLFLLCPLMMLFMHRGHDPPSGRQGAVAAAGWRLRRIGDK